MHYQTLILKTKHVLFIKALEENMKNNVPKPPAKSSVTEKLDFYDKLIEKGLDPEELKVVKRRVSYIDTEFEDIDVYVKKETMLQCINEMLE